MNNQPLTSFVYNPQAQYLFRRAYAVNLGPPKDTKALQYGTQLIGPLQKDAILQPPSPIRIAFDIEKNTFGASSNHSKLSLYNLSSQSRSQIQTGYLVQLYAGYNSLLGLIFTGNVFIGKSERKESDIITTLECLDGGSAITYAVLPSTSYPAGTTLSKILGDVARAMSLVTESNPVGVNAGVAFGIPDVVYGRGFSLSGSCKDILDKLLQPQALEWSVQNGNLNIIPVGNAMNTTATVEIVSANTGLIGVPSKNQSYVQFTTLLNPKLVPGALVRLICENETLNGYYKIRTSKFEGDSHDQKWQVSCECSVPTELITLPPLSNGFNYDPAVLA